MRKSISLLPVMLLATAALHAQVFLAPSVVASGGGTYEGEDFSISWTIGEVAVTTLTGGGLILTQGFQQPSVFGVGLREKGVNWGISVYPNPVGDELRVRFDTGDPGDYITEVQDVTGRLISQQQHLQVHPGDIILINTSGYASGVYILRVLTPDRRQVQVTSLRKL